MRSSKDELAARQALAAIGLEILGEPGGVSSLLGLGNPIRGSEPS